MDLRIAWEDEHLLVVDKPAGVVVHPGTGHTSGTLVHGLLAHDAAGGDDERPGIVHRLDRDTSGLLVVARSDEAHERLQELIRRRQVERRYLALVKGAPRSRTGRIEAPIGRDRLDKTRHSLDTPTPRDAVTHFEVARAARPAGAARAEARDRTDAPDPRAPGGDRPARLRRSGLRRGRRPRPGAAVPPRRAARLRPPVHGRADRASSRRSRTTSPPRWSARASSPEPSPFRSRLRRTGPGTVPGHVPRRRVRVQILRNNSSTGIRGYTFRVQSSVPATRTGGGAALCERFRPRPAGCIANQPRKGPIPWQSYPCVTCWRPVFTSATRPAAGTRR